MEPNQPPLETIARLEALLFVHGEPLTFKKIGDVLGVSAEEVKTLVSEYEKHLAEAGRGLALVSDESKVQLVTRSEFGSIIEQLLRAELAEDLSPASIETLAIIAYFGPISRSRIDYQRGVNSSFILRSLLIRGLIERFPDPDHPHSYLYRPSFDLLKHLGVTRREDLPDYEKFKNLLVNIEAQPPEPEIAAAVAAADQAPTDAIVQAASEADEPPVPPAEPPQPPVQTP